MSTGPRIFKNINFLNHMRSGVQLLSIVIGLSELGIPLATDYVSGKISGHEYAGRYSLGAAKILATIFASSEAARFGIALGATLGMPYFPPMGSVVGALILGVVFAVGAALVTKIVSDYIEQRLLEEVGYNG